MWLGKTGETGQDGKEEIGGRGVVNDVPQTKKPIPKGMDFFAVRKGLEPSTSGVTGRHSNQLNYRTRLVAEGA